MEKRSLQSEWRTEGNKLVGLAAVYDSPTTISEGGRTFTEVIRKGAFRNALASGGDIIATFNHDPSRLLGRTSSGTLKLRDTDEGLAYELDLPKHASDVKEMVERGDIKGCSFTFSVRKGGERWKGNHRELTDVYLAELGPVSIPAYPATNVGLRSGSMEMMRRRIELEEKLIDKCK
jgi:HK97 family phage prohead protease